MRDKARYGISRRILIKNDVSPELYNKVYRSNGDRVVRSNLGAIVKYFIKGGRKTVAITKLIEIFEENNVQWAKAK